MAPNKFEEHIKKQLQEREIQPSARVWESLSEKLDVVAPQKKKKGYFWYSIAASIIGFLIISAVYFNRGDSINQDVQVAGKDEELIKVGTKQKIDNENVDVVEIDKKVHSPVIEIQTELEDQKDDFTNRITWVNKDHTVNESDIEKVKIDGNFQDEIINNKILEVVATVDSLEMNTDALTEAEVNELLRNAQEEILRDRLFDKNGSVDAMALLTEVEDELDQSFRDQIFESLKTGFLKVRTAVADRNK